jgi:hypothetical protein
MNKYIKEDLFLYLIAFFCQIAGKCANNGNVAVSAVDIKFEKMFGFLLSCASYIDPIIKIMENI